MKTYTGFDFICIDVANQAGLDKKLFEQRVQWVKDNFNQLMLLDTPKKERPLYVKAVMALRDACKGIATGHLVGLDATCSGMSIMSVLTKCYNGCLATNLIDPDKRNDAYTMVTTAASVLLEGELIISRDDAKQATMTALYGSQKEPKNIFGEDTPELDAFYGGLSEIAPLAVELLGDLRMAWQAFALQHQWVLPDNFHAIVKVMQKIEGERVEVDELDHSTFTYDYYVNAGTKADLKLVANVTHSFDAYLLRSMDRRCNYDAMTVASAMRILDNEWSARLYKKTTEQNLEDVTEPAHVYMQRWDACRVPDVVILPHLTIDNVRYMADEHIEQLSNIINTMVAWPSFEIVTVHDEFKCHPNNCNQMRWHYMNILADLARGRALEDVYEQITGVVPTYSRSMDGNKLAELILGSNYSLS